jgi:hypothetical protein
VGIFKKQNNDIISQWGPRTFLEFTAQDIYRDGPVVDFYKKQIPVEQEIQVIKALGKPDVQQSLLQLHKMVLRDFGFPLVTTKASEQDKAVETFAHALLRTTASTVSGNSHREDPTGFELGLCIVIGESLCRLSRMKLRDKYGELLSDGLITLTAWMLNFDSQKP